MVDVTRLKAGDKVCYVNPYNKNEWENGIVKSLNDGTDEQYNVYVVYNCGDDWDNYMNYRGARTNPMDLEIGWRNEAQVDEMVMKPIFTNAELNDLESYIESIEREGVYWGNRKHFLNRMESIQKKLHQMRKAL